MIKKDLYKFINKLETNGHYYQNIFQEGINIYYNLKFSCENFIKNHFYSRLRKSVRKLNKFITNLFFKKYNKFNLNIIFKLSNIS